MRTLVLAGVTMVTVFGAPAADAQRIAYPGASYPVPARGLVQQPGSGVRDTPPPPPMARPRPGPARGDANRVQAGGSRWGGSVGGRWSAGSDAPGGWNAYRRPSGGWQVPSYRTAPQFFIGDYAGYGLSTPPQGYGWQRYYDDAVLIDARGRVADSRAGIDWDGGYGYDGGRDGYSSYDHAASEYGDGYVESSESEAGHAPPRTRYEPPRYRPLPPPVYGGVVTTYQTGGYASGYGTGYAAPGTTTTVITIQPVETVTTTTTEYIEETRYAAPRRVYHAPKRVYRARPSCTCKRVVR